MRIYIRHNHLHAGGPIYRGFAAAWHKIGSEVRGYGDMRDIDDDGEYEIMSADYDYGYPSYALAHNQRHQNTPDHPTQPNHVFTLEKSRDIFRYALQRSREVVRKAKKVYMYTQPTHFPLPWGGHPNFSSMVKDTPLIEELTSANNVVLWNWGDLSSQVKEEWFAGWGDALIHRVPLAFDSISYKPIEDSAYAHDVCFVGGWANNGFDEKRAIMIEHFKALMKTGLKCGVFVDKNISHEQENLLLYNSKVSLNIHDSYQRIFGNDSNERTFKALGLTGAMVCDNIRQVKNLFPDLPLYSTPEEMVEQIQTYVGNAKLLQETKEHYRGMVANNHTYVHRVQQMRDL